MTETESTEESRNTVKHLWQKGISRARRFTGSLIKIQVDAEMTREALEYPESQPLLVICEKMDSSYEEPYIRYPLHNDVQTDSEFVPYARGEPGLGTESDLNQLESVEFSNNPLDERSFTTGLVVGLSFSVKNCPPVDSLQEIAPSDSVSSLSDATLSNCTCNCHLASGLVGQEKCGRVFRSDDIFICGLD